MWSFIWSSLTSIYMVNSFNVIFFWFGLQLPRLTPYVRFCSCQLKACQLLQNKVETNPEFKQLEKVIAKNNLNYLKSISVCFKFITGLIQTSD